MLTLFNYDDKTRFSPQQACQIAGFEEFLSIPLVSRLIQIQPYD